MDPTRNNDPLLIETPDSLEPQRSRVPRHFTFPGPDKPVLNLRGLPGPLPAFSNVTQMLGFHRAFVSVDGGASGKTELFHTAASALGMEYLSFDLRRWCHERVATPAARCTALRLLNGGDRDEFVQVFKEWRVPPEKELGWHRFRQLYGEGYNRQIKWVQDLLLTAFREEIMSEAKAAPQRLMLIDEVDLTSAGPHHELEISAFEKVLRYLGASGKQVALILHPKTLDEPRIMKIVDTDLPGVRQFSMEHLPETLARALLSRARLDEGAADRFYDRWRGYPPAYLDLLLMPRGSETLDVDPDSFVRTAEKKLTHSASFTLAHAGTETERLLRMLADGRFDRSDLRSADARRLLRSSLAYRNRDDQLAIAPAIREIVLSKAARAEA